MHVDLLLYFDIVSSVTLSLRSYRASLCVSAVFATLSSGVRLSRWCIVFRRLKILSNFLLGPVAPSF